MKRDFSYILKILAGFSNKNNINNEYLSISHINFIIISD